MSSKYIVIAAGGTGGHMFPAQALAETLLARGWSVTLSSDTRGLRYAGAFPDAVKLQEVKSATLARGGLAAKLKVPFSLLGGVVSAIRQFRAKRPDIVVGFGGYPAFPAMLAAWVLGIPRIIHEQNGVLGKVNRLFAKRVDLVACGTWPTELPEGTNADFVGNPVRAAVHDVAGATYTPPSQDKINILVIGGSQGASIFARVVPEAISKLPAEWKTNLHVTQQARPEDNDRVHSVYWKAGIKADIQPFVDVPVAMSAAQLVISRAGASSIADISAIGRPAILVPYAAASEDHQSANARGLVDAGAAKLIKEDDFTVQALHDAVLSIISAPNQASMMASSALSLGRPDATDRLAEHVETISEMQSKG